MRSFPLLLVMLTSTSAAAVNLNHFGPGRAGPSLFSLDAPELLPAGGYAARTTYSLANQPLACVAPELPDGPHDLDTDTNTEPGRRAVVIQNMHLASVALAYSVVDALELSVGLPALSIDARNGLIEPPCGGSVTGTHFGWSDPELRMRWRVLDFHALVVSLRGGFHAPFAELLQTDARAFFGDRWGNGFLGGTLGVRHRRLQGIIDVGMVFRPWPDPIPMGVYGAALVQDEVTFGAGLLADLAWGFTAAVELNGRYVEVVDQRTGERETHVPLEVIGGLKYDVGDFEVTLGAGAGLSTGYGTPRARILSSVSYTGGGLFPLDWLRSLPDWTPDIDVDVPALEDEVAKLRATRVPREDPRAPQPTAEPSAEQPCPDPNSPEGRLVVVPGCPRPTDEVQPERDDPVDVEPVIDVLDEPEREAHPSDAEGASTRELVIVLHLTFAHDVDTLAAGERERLLRELAAPPVGGQLVAVTVRAHADASGDDEHNDALSLRRAAHVAAVLERSGVPAAIIRQEARGARDPLLADALHDANRRVRVALHYRLPKDPPR